MEKKKKKIKKIEKKLKNFDSFIIDSKMSRQRGIYSEYLGDSKDLDRNLFTNGSKSSKEQYYTKNSRVIQSKQNKELSSLNYSKKQAINELNTLHELKKEYNKEDLIKLYQNTRQLKSNINYHQKKNMQELNLK